MAPLNRTDMGEGDPKIEEQIRPSLALRNWSDLSTEGRQIF